MTDDTLYPCSCCGFLMFDEPPGTYVICSVCGWEDDLENHPLYTGGANRTSLKDLQEELLKSVPANLASHAGYERAVNWRPLTEADLQTLDPPRGMYKYYWEDKPRRYP